MDCSPNLSPPNWHLLSSILKEKLEKYTKVLEPILKEHLDQVDGKRKEEEEEEKQRLVQEHESVKQGSNAKEQEERDLVTKKKKKSSASFTILMVSFTVLILAFLFWNFKGRV
jgi:high-affinity Fe2+/Pb2+ permease